MNKKFFEVFPTLKVKDDMRLLLQDVEVSKVTTNSNRDFVRIHIESAHLLQQTSDPEKTYLRSRTPAKTAAVCQKSYPGVGKRAV